MVSSLQKKLSAIEEYTPGSNLNSIVGQVPPSQLIVSLQIHVLQINSRLAAVLTSGQEDDEMMELRKTVEEIRNKKRIYSILEAVPCGPGENELRGVIDDFMRITAPRAHPSLTSFPTQNGFLFSNLFNRIHTEHNMRVAGIKGAELTNLITACQSDEELLNITRSLTAQQASEVVLSDLCIDKIPRIIVSLSKNVLFELLIGITNEQAAQVNKHLQIVRNAEWFTQKFKDIRKEVAAFCNKQTDKINRLNEELRDLPVSKISMNEVRAIENLRHEIFLARDAQLRLGILIKNVIIDIETKRLFYHELPQCYERLLARLSSHKDVHKVENVTGCPFGILFRNSFQEYADFDESDDSGLLSVICSWNLPHWTSWVDAGIMEKPDGELLAAWNADLSLAFQQGLKNLGELGLHSVNDLKQNHIYNSEMLIDYIFSKREALPVLSTTQRILGSAKPLFKIFGYQ